jgi:hypothetical protein
MINMEYYTRARTMPDKIKEMRPSAMGKSLVKTVLKIGN